jgi:septal ring-binding cell division protein DamX
MAERRYDFRFSFAEGCIIVASMMAASFLVFLFGIYAGREMEARKAAEHTRMVRTAISQEGQGSSPSHAGGPPVSTKEAQDKPASGTPSPAVPVVVVAPQKPNEPPPSSSPLAASVVTPPPEKMNIAKPEPSPQKGRVDLANQNRRSNIAPLEAPRPLGQDKKPQTEETATASPPSKQTQPTSGRWSVQVNATRDEAAAQQLARQLRSQGYAPIVSKIERDGEVWYRVRVGSFTNAAEARAAVERFRREGKFHQAYPTSN